MSTTCDHCDELRPNEEIAHVGRHTYCHGCLPGIVEAAIEFEFVWRSSGLEGLDSLDQSAAILGPDLIQRYTEREERWRTPVDRRLFCPHVSEVIPGQEQRCNHFLGRKRDFVEGGLHQWQICPICESEICTICGRELTETEEPDPAARRGHCTRTSEMLAEEANRRAGERGTEYQICPACARPTEQTEGCNEMTCDCGQTYCYICGERTRGEEHWRESASTCPRFGRRAAENQIFDNHMLALENWDAFASNFEELDRDALDAQWREAADAIRAADREFRVPRHHALQQDDQADMWRSRLMLSARHLAAMMHNGFQPWNRPELLTEMNHAIRRIRFAHHGALFRYYHNRLLRRFPDGLEITGGQQLYADLAPHARLLRFQIGAVPDITPDRMQEFTDFTGIVNPLLDHYSLDYIQDLIRLRLAQPSDNALQTHELLLPVRRMLDIFQRGNNGAHEVFSLADSHSLRIELAKLRAVMAYLEGRENGVQRFRDAGTEQDGAYQIANLFLNRLLTDEDLDVEPWRDAEDDAAFWGWSSDWICDMLDSLNAEGRTLAPNQPINTLAGPIPRLHAALQTMLEPVRNIMNSGGNLGAIPGWQLREVQNLRDRLHPDEWHQEGLIGGASRGLRPLFFTLLWYVNMIVQHNRGRVPSSRASSVSTNAGNDPVHDCHLIADIQSGLQGRVIQDLRGNRDAEISFRTQRLLDLLPALHHIALRLAHPGIYPGPRNQEAFDAVREAYEQMQAQFGHHADFGRRRRVDEDRIVHLLARCMPQFEASVEVNPARRVEDERMPRIAERLREAAALVNEGFDDRMHIEAILQRFLQDQNVWGRPDGQWGHFERRFIDFMIYIGLASTYYALPEGLRSNNATQRLDDERRFLEHYDVHRTPAGDLEQHFERLYNILQALREADAQRRT